MGWFTTNETTNFINENTSVQEGYHKAWSLTFKKGTPVSLSVHRIDECGPNIYLMTLAEYDNYIKGLTFRYVSAMSFENIDTFSSTATLRRDKYMLVATLPKIYDGGDSCSYFSIRFEEVA